MIDDYDEDDDDHDLDDVEPTSQEEIDQMVDKIERRHGKVTTSTTSEQQQEQKKENDKGSKEKGGSKRPVLAYKYSKDQDQRRDNEGKEDSSKRESQQSQSFAEILVQLASENVESLFKDQYGTAYALVHITDHDEIIRVESNKFKRYLSKLFYDNNQNRVVNADAITNAIQVLQAKAEFEGQTIPLSLRVTWYTYCSQR